MRTRIMYMKDSEKKCIKVSRHLKFINVTANCLRGLPSYGFGVFFLCNSQFWKRHYSAGNACDSENQQPPFYSTFLPHSIHRHAKFLFLWSKNTVFIQVQCNCLEKNYRLNVSLRDSTNSEFFFIFFFFIESYDKSVIFIPLCKISCW